MRTQVRSAAHAVSVSDRRRAADFARMRASLIPRLMVSVEAPLAFPNRSTVASMPSLILSISPPSAAAVPAAVFAVRVAAEPASLNFSPAALARCANAVSYTHLRAHET